MRSKGTRDKGGEGRCGRKPARRSTQTALTSASLTAPSIPLEQPPAMSGTPSKQSQAGAGAASSATSPHNLSVTSPARNTRSRSASPQPRSPTTGGGAGSAAVAPHSPSAHLTRSMDKLRLSQQHQQLGADESGHISTAALDASMSLLTLRASPPHAAASSTTGLVYDPRCLLHQANHHHVEQPARASTTMTLLQSSGLYARCVLVPTRRATDDELIGMAHTKEHVASIDATVNYDYKPAELDSETEGDTTLYPDCKFLDSDTYVNQYSSAAARLSIGGLINLMEEVVAGRLQNGFAVIRPPGHHADCVKAQGFCLYNNVAVAVQNMRARHPQMIQRVLIIDWDVHHGNGTQNIFYKDPSVLYFSIHRYQNASFYPHTGAHTEVGEGPGVGRNINVPLNCKGLGDVDYLEVFHTLLLPVLREFAPDLVVVSAGFDCAQGDPLGGMEISSEGFGAMTRLLMEHMPKHKRLVMALEGGYNVRAVSEAVKSCTSALLGDALEPLPDPHAFLGKRELSKLAAKQELFRKDLKDCVQVQQKYWKCLKGMPEGEDVAPAAAAAGTAAPAQAGPPGPAAAASASAASSAPTTVTAAAATVVSVTVAAPTATASPSAASAPAASANVTIASPPKPAHH